MAAHALMLARFGVLLWVTFEGQPKGFAFRLDYSGDFGDSRRTTTHRPDAKIFSIAVTEWAR